MFQSIQRFISGDGLLQHRPLLSPETFRDLLERERARSDRNGQLFAVVLLRLPQGNGGSHESLRRLGDYLAGRIRETDAIGLCDGPALGILLFGANAAGANTFIGNARRRAPESLPEFSATVHAYPVHGPGSGGAPGPGARSGDDRGTADRDAGHLRESPRMGVCGEAPAEDVRGLFVRPLPLWKRFVDIVVSSFLLVLLSPVFVGLALFIKAVSPGPVLFRQIRVGWLGRPFTFWKFRTMHVDNDRSEHEQYLSELIRSDRPMIKLDEKRDPRIIPFGRGIRNACLDELPQLLNVLRGDMSLVGPRPCLPNEASQYLPWHQRRFDTVPGMTGLWQVNGKNKTTFRQMIRFDIGYQQRMSLRNDIAILMRTGPAVVAMLVEFLSNRRAKARKSVPAAVMPE